MDTPLLAASPITLRQYRSFSTSLFFPSPSISFLLGLLRVNLSLAVNLPRSILHTPFTWKMGSPDAYEKPRPILNESLDFWEKLAIAVMWHWTMKAHESRKRIFLDTSSDFRGSSQARKLAVPAKGSSGFVFAVSETIRSETRFRAFRETRAELSRKRAIRYVVHFNRPAGFSK